jgi:hypothetical protein
MELLPTFLRIESGNLVNSAVDLIKSFLKSGENNTLKYPIGNGKEYFPPTILLRKLNADIKIIRINMYSLFENFP